MLRYSHLSKALNAQRRFSFVVFILMKESFELKAVFIVIEIILLIMTYWVSNSLFATGIATFIVFVSYMFDDEHPFLKAWYVFCVACLSGLIFIFGAYAENLAEKIPNNGTFDGLKACLDSISKTLTSGATPPFNIIGEPASDIAIFVFGFACIEIIFTLIKHTRAFR